jgi:DNA polymerase III subunit epsilon
MKLIYIDTETDGLDPKKNSIVQLAGIIRVNGQEEEFDFKMAPWPGRESDPEALAISGRTIEEVKGYPAPAEIFRLFIGMLTKYVSRYDKKDKFFCLAYNAMFDDDFMRAWFEVMGDKYYGSWFWTPALDVMQAAAFTLMKTRHDLPNFKLATVAKAVLGVDPPEGSFHDAMFDVRTTRDLAKVVAPGFTRQEGNGK